MNCTIDKFNELLKVHQRRYDHGKTFGRIKSLTIVVQSFERQFYLLRQIAHWRNSEATVVIFDQSTRKLDNEILGLITSFKNIRYIFTDQNICDRFFSAKSYILTPYAVFMGDDEFLLESALDQAIERLEKNEKTVGCIGQSLRFDHKGGLIPIQYRRGYDHYGYSIKGEVGERIYKLLIDYRAATPYAVLRSDVWINSYCHLQQYSCISLMELEQAVITILFGEMESIDSLYWLRSDEQPTKFVKNIWEVNKIAFEDWWTLPEFESEKKSWLDKLTALGILLGHDKKKSLEALTLGFNIYVDFIKTDRTSHKKKLFSLGYIREILGKIWPIFFSKKTIFLLRRSLSITSEIDLQNLISNGMPGNDVRHIKNDTCIELLDIESLIHQFYFLRRMR